MKIYSLTLNPALDLSGCVQDIVPNEKNYVSIPRFDPGGNGINSIRILNRLGIPARPLGFLGGPTGSRVKELLKKEGVRGDFIEIAEDTRMNVTVTKVKDHQQTRLTFPGPKISPQERQKLFRQIAALRGPGIFVIGGSLPQNCPMTYVQEIVRNVSRNGFGVILDLPSRSLKNALNWKGSPYLLIKPNRAELEELLNRKLDHDLNKIREGVSHLKFKVGLVCVSLGSQGALLIQGQRCWLGEPLPIRARGSVGAGDSMVGAMVAKLAEFGISNPEQIHKATDAQLKSVLSWGIAAGSATALTLGTSLGDARKIRQLVRKVKVQCITE